MSGRGPSSDGPGCGVDDARVGLVAMVGVLVAKAVASGRYLDYVRHRMSVPLVATAVLLIAVSVMGAIGAVGRPPGGWPPPAMTGARAWDDAGAASQRNGLSRRAGSMLAVPVVLMGVVPAAPLGAFAAGRQPVGWRAPPALFPPLPAAVAGAVPMGLSDFVSRALYDPARSLKGVRVRMIGFSGLDPSASRDGSGGSRGSRGYLLVRFAMYCCAADALAIRVRISGAPGPRPPPDTWLQIIGTWRPAGTLSPGPFDPDAIPTVDALAVRRIPAPADPYDGSV